MFLAGGLVAAEGVVAAGFGVVEATQFRPERAIVAIGTTLVMALYGVLLICVGRGLGLARRWSRGPAVATQLLHLPAAWSFLGGQTSWVAYLLGGSSLVALICIFLPSSTALLAREPDEKSYGSADSAGSTSQD